MEHFHLSYAQAMNEPWEAIEQAQLIWSLRSDKTDADQKRAELTNGSNSS